jgi:putative transposase
MKTLKVEEVYLAGYETFADLATRLPLFIEEVYNANGFIQHVATGSPNEFQLQLAQEAA